jgi:hypothetical protein
MCQSVPGGNIDRAVGNLLLASINPMTTDAAISIQREMVERKEEILRLYGQQMERARYEMELAKRRYLRVDPDNRLVASELEYEWNQRINEYESAKSAYESKCETEIRAVDEKLRAALNQLVQDFPRIWNDPLTSHKEKKRIARLVLDDVTITSDVAKVILGIRFKGGATKIIELVNTSRNLDMEQMETDAIAEISSLMKLGLTNHEIAEKLNAKGFKKEIAGKLYDKNTIGWLIQKHGLTQRKYIAKADGWLTAKEKMAELGVGDRKLRHMRRNGDLEYKVCNINGTAYMYRPEKTAIL